MAHGFSLPNMSCLSLEGSGHNSVAPTPAATTARQQQQQQQPSRSSRNDGGGGIDAGGGFLASGLSWFDKQREKRRREYLQQEAEKQLQKIARATQRAANDSTITITNTNSSIHAAAARNHSLISSSSSSSSSCPSQKDDDGDFVMPNNSLKSSASESSEEEGNANANTNRNTNRNTNTNTNAHATMNANANANANATRDKKNRNQHSTAFTTTTTTTTSSSSNNITHQQSRSNSFGTSDVSKSGEGASGTLDLSDIAVLGCSSQISCKNCNEDDINDSNSINDDTTTNDNHDSDDINNNNNNNNNNDNGDINDDINDEESTIPPVRVTHVEGDDASPYILSQNQMDEISKHVLPETITYCRWRRLYGLGRDGDSFEGCLRIIGTEKRTLMVVRTTKGDIFGGYADAPWHSRQANATAKFYGSASSCLYSFSSVPTESSTSSSPEDSSINVYRWTGKNRYIQVCDVYNKMLAFGGGGDKGAFGLCLQEDFQRGTTGHCDTFDNDPLCSGSDRTFGVVDVEFWEFLTGVF